MSAALENFGKWSRVIRDELAQSGKLTQATLDYFAENPAIVENLQRNYLDFRVTSHIEDFVADMKSRNHRTFYIHGVTKNLGCHIESLVKFGHLELLQEVEDCDEEKVLFFIKYHLNHLFKIDETKHTLDEIMMQWALRYNNVEIVCELRNNYDVAVTTDHLSEVAESNNPMFLGFLEEKEPLKLKDVFTVLSESVKVDSYKLVEILAPRVEFRRHQLKFMATSLHHDSPKSFDIMCRIYPEVTIVDIFENDDDDYPPTLHRIVLNASAELNLLVDRQMKLLM